MDMHIHIF